MRSLDLFPSSRILLNSLSNFGKGISSISSSSGPANLFFASSINYSKIITSPKLFFCIYFATSVFPVPPAPIIIDQYLFD